MQAGKTGTSNFHDLRQRVKKAMHRLSRNTSAQSDNHSLSPTAAQQLLHRLHIYQIELERQDEELRQTKQELETARSRYFDLLEYTSTLYNQAPVGYLTLAHDGTIVEANLTAATQLTLTRERLLQQPATLFIVAEDQDAFEEFRNRLLETRKPQACELRMMRADGTYFYAQLDATPTADILNMGSISDNPESKLYIRTTISDITTRVQLQQEESRMRAQLEETLADLRQTQAQMVKQERLAVVGQLAAGIAHDFNNILAAITLYAQLIMRSSELPASLRARMEVIVVQTGRATHLIQQILDFSRRTLIARQPTSLAPFLQQIVELLQHTLPETIRVSLETDAVASGIEDVVDIDPPRIQQALLNLAFNARDAMPEGGELHINLSRIFIDHADADHAPSAIASGTLTPGSWLRIDVTDTGTGIHAQDLPHIFEPFFTTKGVGKGSGLGLAQVWGIVKQHDGEIDIMSEVGRGTTFSIYLSAVSKAPPVSDPVETAAIPQGNGEVVLMVEDNDVLRSALVSTLEQLGYRVLEASDGQDATRLMSTDGNKVKVILSDLIMPVMGGEALIRTLRAQGWQQPIVVLSGHPLPMAEIEQLYSHGQISCLLKPPSLEQLAAALHQALHPQSVESDK